MRAHSRTFVCARTYNHVRANTHAHHPACVWHTHRVCARVVGRVHACMGVCVGRFVCVCDTACVLEAKGLPHFEAVRFPIQRGGSLVLDTRCLHGGAPGDGSPGLRAHAYGLVYDDDAEPDCAAAALEKDYLTTVDILDRDGIYAPVGTWGSRSNLWG